MINLLRIFTIIAMCISFSYNTQAFDLKSLTDKLQKDIGSKLQIPKGEKSGNNSNPLGNLLKNSKSNTIGTTSIGSGSIAQSSASGSDIKVAKSICEYKVSQILKNLPKGNISDLSDDFNNKNTDEIKKILNSSPKRPDRFVETLATYDGTFETKEVEEIFSSFLSTKSLESLATLKALSTIKTGFGKNKKQIKADALFAYGLVHYFYSANGSNKTLGIDLISQTARTPDNIGAMTLFGAWEFFGINRSVNILNGNKMALDGYNRQDEKNRERLVMGPFFEMKENKYPEIVFFEIAANDKNPYKQQYQSQLAQASQMNKDVMASLKSSEKYDQKSGWWPVIVSQQNRQYSIISNLGDNIGLAKKLKPLKAQYEVLKTKIAKDPTNTETVEEMVIINQQLVDIVGESLGSVEAVDEKGKTQIKILASDNELLILKNQSIALSVMADMLAQGGFSQGFFELTKMTEIIGRNRSIACKTYSGVKS